MKKLLLLVVMGFLAVGLVGWVAAGDAGVDDEKEISIGDLPYGLVKMIHYYYPGAEIEEASVEMEDGMTVYDVEIEFGDHELELEVAQMWRILEVEADEDEDGDEDDGDEEDEDDDDEDEDEDDL